MPKISGEKAEKLAEIAKIYVENPDVTVEELSERYDIPTRTIFYHLKKLQVSRRGPSPAETTIRKKEIDALAAEAEKISTIAIGLGGVIARRHLPLLDHLLAEGKTLEYIAEDLMSWYNMRLSTEAHIKSLEMEVEGLRQKLEEAYGIAAPNFKFMLKAQILLNYANRLVAARMYGVRIPVKPALQALQRDLEALDQDLEEEIESEQET